MPNLAHDSPSNTPFAWMATLNSSALTGVLRISEACLKAGLAWQQELARFATARLQRDAELSQEVLRSHSWADAMKLQQDWATSLGQDYADEAGRLMRLAQGIGADLMHSGAGGFDPAVNRARDAAE